MFRRVLAIQEKRFGPGHPAAAVALNNLAGIYRLQERFGEAEELLERALAIYEEKLGPGRVEVAQALGNLAALYRAQGRDEEAGPLLERARLIREKISKKRSEQE